jgi:DHA2 family multidrug resistance protein
LISGLLVSGAIVTAAFVVREFVAKSPFLNLHVLFGGQLLILMLLLAGFRFIILSTAYIIPIYLQTVQSFRELQVGSVLLWIALPQFAIMWPLAAMLKYVDARWVLAAGSALIAVACLMATGLTSQWATDDFLPSQILQAIGQSFALTALVVLIVQSINPRDVLTIGSFLQISRLFGGELGTAFMQTFVRVREQIHSNLLGLHVDAFSSVTGNRLLGYSSIVGARTSDLANSSSKAANLLAGSVAQQAEVLSYIDGFTAAAGGAVICLLLAVFLRPAAQPPTG